MKRFLPVIFLIILLSSAIYSCRSSRQTESSYTGTTALTLDSAYVRQSSYDILSFLRSNRRLELTGITVDFFPPVAEIPDSVNGPEPDAVPRASPKSIRIESVSSTETISDTTLESGDTDDRQTVNLSDSSDVSDNRTTEAKSSSGFSWLWLIPLSIFIVTAFLGWYMRKAGPPP